MTALLSCICVDDIQQEIEVTAAPKLQQVCMYGLFNVQRKAYKVCEALLTSCKIIKEGHPVEDMGSLYGVKCADGLVSAINYREDNTSL